MDNTNQAVPGYFNLKAYGLVNYLLQNNIPVKWAIKAGKAKDGIDFTCFAARAFPSFTAPASYNFKAGPFIIDAANAAASIPLIMAYGNNVAVYQLTQNIFVDIRYTLTFKPRPVVCSNGGNQNIHSSILLQAGITNANFSVLPAGQAVPLCGYSLASEPHWDALSDTAETYAIQRYILNGGNFFSQCRGVYIYESDDTLHTTKGIVNTSANVTTFAYLNPDLPIMQFEGALGNPGGSLKNWNLAAGSAYRPTTYTGVRASTGTPYQILAGTKRIPNNLSGGNIFYLGGHDYGASTATDMINGRRVYLNAVFVPPGPGVVCLVLPVELLYFNAKENSGKIKLEWETGSEINNSHFVLERSRDGVEYTFVGQIEGHGNSTEVQHYEYTDIDPLYGVSYYRLTQFDYDGRSEKFAPISATLGLKYSSITLYPNPLSTNKFFAQIPANSEINKIQVKDVRGILIYEEEISATAEALAQQIELPNDLLNGIYTVHFLSEKQESIERLTVFR